MERELPADSSVAMTWVHPMAKGLVPHRPAPTQAVRWTTLVYSGLLVRMYINTEPFLVLQFRYIYYVVNQLMCRLTVGRYWKESVQLFVSVGLETLLM